MGFRDTIRNIADLAASSAMKSSNDEQRLQATKVTENLLKQYDNWFDNANIDELKKGLEDERYRIRVDAENNCKREYDLCVKISRLEREQA